MCVRAKEGENQEPSENKSIYNRMNELDENSRSRLKIASLKRHKSEHVQ